MSARRKLVLVDGSGYLYRAFHALPPLANSRGEPTGAVLGVVNMLQKLCKEESPELMAVVFDAPGRTFRDELFEEYKAQRTPMPDELRVQLQPLLECVQAMGLPLLRIEGVEADDVIGTLARRAAEKDMDVLISTGDKDMAQLVAERITLVNTMTGSRLDREGVKNKFGVWPEQIIDYLALVGDSIDNIPGVDKVGPKTAAKWLNEYNTLDKLLENAAKITGKVGENLRASTTDIELSRKLATIDCNVPLDYEPESLIRREPDRARLRELYTRLEFRSLLRQLEPDGSAETGAVEPDSTLMRQPRPAQNYECVRDLDTLRAWVERLKASPVVAFEVAASSGDYMHADIVGVSFCIEPGHAAYVPVGHAYAGAAEQLSPRSCWKPCGRCWKARRPKRWVTTSSSMLTCSRVMASSCAACASIACWSPTS
jgi:DNA polymerase-1